MIDPTYLTGLAACFAFGTLVGFLMVEVARRKADAFRDTEIKFLRGQWVRENEHTHRMDRVDKGLYEIPPEKPEKVVVPERVLVLCNLFPPPAAAALVNEAKVLFARGFTWENIEDQIRRQIEEQDPLLLEGLP